jgi:hypothetical protein
VKRPVALLGAVLLAGGGCRDDSLRPAPLPPQSSIAAVADLTTETLVTTPYASAVRLHWTVPALPSGGDSVRQFEVRSATRMLGGDEWLAVPPVLELNSGASPGDEMAAVLSGLEQGPTYAFVVRGLDTASRWTAWSNVASFATVNSAPVARFTVRADSTCPEVPLTVDASSSSDQQDPAERLRVRWDWEGDGVWDTPWSTIKTATHQYAAARVYPVRLQVLDGGGWQSEPTTHPVVRGPVLLERAQAGFSYWEMHYICPPSSPSNPEPCFWDETHGNGTTPFLGPYARVFDSVDQVSCASVDSVSFDAGDRAPLSTWYVFIQTTLEVDFFICAPVAYAFSGHGDGDDFSLRWTGPNGSLLDHPFQAGSADFELHGTLAAGRYHLAAARSSGVPAVLERLRFSLVFGAAASRR